MIDRVKCGFSGGMPGAEKAPRGETFSRHSVIAYDMGLSLLVEPHLGFNRLGFGNVDHYDVVSVSKIDLPALEHRLVALRFGGVGRERESGLGFVVFEAEGMPLLVGEDFSRFRMYEGF